MATCSFVPPYLLARLADTGGDTGDGCRRTLTLDEHFRGLRERRAATAMAAAAPAPAAGPDWVVHDAQQGTELPGVAVRTAGTDRSASGDPAVDEAADGIAATLELFMTVYGRDSFDGAGATCLLSVHYERDYANAFWDGTHLVFGDGDGKVFDRFTRAIDVLAHEFTHAVTERTAGLAYRDQAGALNESVSDVFAACLAQRVLGQTADQADWLIGAQLFLPGVNARGLRDMAAPGTAYDDPALGRDPQPGHLDDLVVTTDDNGGVHINSGIPNRAFVLAARAIGGHSWEGAGRIWYAALTGGSVGADTDFAGFAAATVAVAGEHADAVAGAWAEVGVTVPVPVPAPDGAAPDDAAPDGAAPDGAAPDGAAPEDAGPEVPGASRSVRVSRSGGVTGMTSVWTVDLDADDDVAVRARSLVERVDFSAFTTGQPAPDRFVYGFEVDGRRFDVPEQRLSGDLAELARLVREQGRGLR